MLTHEQISLVQNTFKTIEPIAGTAAQLFYNRLFELDPALRPLFPDDLTEQQRKLMQMISVSVNGLTHLEMIVPQVRELGARHVNYGVQPEHYATVGAALLWALEQGLGDLFTPDVREAWATTYQLLAETALAGAEAF